MCTSIKCLVFQASDTTLCRVSVSSGLLAGPLTEAQNFECKMHNIFDKPLEVRGDKSNAIPPPDLLTPGLKSPEFLRLYLLPS